MRRRSGLLGKLRNPGNAAWILIAFGFIFALPAWMAGERLSFNLLVFVSSLMLLVKSAGCLVDSSSWIARYFGVPAIIIGITVVAFGTSLPELTVSAIANMSGEVGISIGNIVGSNISNICLVLGLAAVLVPITVRREVFRFDVPFLLGISVLLPLLSLTMFFDFSGGVFVLGRIDGLIMLALFGIFMFVQIRGARREHALSLSSGKGRKTQRTEGKKLMRNLILLVAGIAGVIVSAGILVESSSEIALIFGVPQEIIGLTMVAVGTSLPELATNIMAALKKRLDLALGNVIGSNVFNILLVLGLSSLIKPIEGISRNVVMIDMPIMVGITFLLAFFMKTGRTIYRREGIVLIAIYVLYIVMLSFRI